MKELLLIPVSSGGSPTHTQGQFRVSGPTNAHVFGLKEENWSART